MTTEDFDKLKPTEQSIIVKAMISAGKNPKDIAEQFNTEIGVISCLATMKSDFKNTNHIYGTEGCSIKKRRFY